MNTAYSIHMLQPLNAIVESYFLKILCIKKTNSQAIDLACACLWRASLNLNLILLFLSVSR